MRWSNGKAVEVIVSKDALSQTSPLNLPRHQAGMFTTSNAVPGEKTPHSFINSC